MGPHVARPHLGPQGLKRGHLPGVQAAKALEAKVDRLHNERRDGRGPHSPRPGIPRRHAGGPPFLPVRPQLAEGLRIAAHALGHVAGGQGRCQHSDDEALMGGTINGPGGDMRVAREPFGRPAEPLAGIGFPS